MPQLTPDQLRLIPTMRDQGIPVHEISLILQISVRSVYRAISRSDNGNVQYRQRGGSVRKTTLRQDRLIRRTARNSRTSTGSKIRRNFFEATGVQVAGQTIRRRLHEVGLKARRRAACPFLKPQHRAARQLWAERHIQWGIAEWSRCMFADESRFTLFRADGRMLVWRGRNERFLQENMEARVAFGGEGVTVWGGISMNENSELVILRQSMNGERYRDLCVRNIVVPYAENIGDGFIFVDDNARPHRAGIVNDFLRDQGIERMDWPPMFPDMNPIEHVWSRMKLKMKDREGRIENLEELMDAVQQEWDSISQEFIDGLIRSMPKRVAAVFASQGGPTKY